MRIIQLIKQANRPGPPEDSIVFRLATTACVVIGIVACWAQGELSIAVTGVSVALVVVGNVFSYARRSHPPSWLKIVVALAAVSAFLWFFFSISRAGVSQNLGAVEGPLAVLFTWIQVTHAFDVPSRRDLGFSLAGSAILMAVAAAQAIDLTFGLYVIGWATAGLVSLVAMWSSMVGGITLRWRGALIAAVLVLAVAACFEAVLPAPHVSATITFPASVGDGTSITTPAGLTSPGGEPTRAATTSGSTRVGGFLGFAGPLNTAMRGSLGNEVIMRVRADRPTFWIAETFDYWNGQSWTQKAPSGHPEWQTINSGSPFSLPVSTGAATQGTPDIQTFYIAQNGPNLVFHAAETAEVWFPGKRLFVDADGNIRSSVTMGQGSIYTVESDVSTPTVTQLTAPSPSGDVLNGLTAADVARFTQLPHPYPRVAALARAITANAHSTVAKVLDLERWIGTHTRYTTQIPPLTPGQDTVDEFLFGNRRGYCEQISTSLAVMLRTLGIPTREATGYVPGPYDPITDLYDVQAKDAHAWIQVWFPGYGWQSFDPTADVATANPTPGDALVHDALHALGRLPLLPIGLAIAFCALAAALWRHRKSAPLSWEAKLTREIERAARRAHITEEAGETLLNLAIRLDRAKQVGAGPPHTLKADHMALHLVVAAEGSAYGLERPDAKMKKELLSQARHLRRQAHRLSGRPQAFSSVRAPAPHPKMLRQKATSGRT